MIPEIPEPVRIQTIRNNSRRRRAMRDWIKSMRREAVGMNRLRRVRR